MLRKNYFILLSVIGVVLLSTVFASAQIVNITGRVEMVNEDGTTKPVEGALVEIYQVDVKSGNKSDKTDSKGNFSFVGVPPGAKYFLTISGEGVESAIFNASAGSQNGVFKVKAGDGTKFTEEQVRGANSGGGELTQEQKKKQAELDKKLEEAKAKNARIEKANTIIPKVLKEGNDAFNSKNYDLAIAKYQEGYDISEDFVGSAPVLLNNKAEAYRLRAVDNFNASIKSTDAATKTELKQKAKQDFEASLVDFNKSWLISKNAKPAEITNKENYESVKMNALLGGNKVVGLMIRTDLVAASKGEEAKELVTEYIKAESDKAKSAEAQTNLGRFVFGTGDMDGAIAAYRVAVEMSPKDPEALSGLGLALYSASFEKEELKQESLNYMQYYLDVSPKDHSLRESIEGAVEDLKAQKLKPQKISKN